MSLTAMFADVLKFKQMAGSNTTHLPHLPEWTGEAEHWQNPQAGVPSTA